MIDPMVHGAALRVLSTVGDSRFLLPVALFTGLAWCRERPRIAIAWWIGIALAGLLVAASKLAYLLGGFAIERIGFYGLSGHATTAAAVWPVALHALGWHRTRRQRDLQAIAGALIAMLIAWSRVRLDLHSTSEVIGGLLTGALVSIAMIVRLRDALRTRAWMVLSALSGAALLFCLVLPWIDLQMLLEWLAKAKAKTR